MTEPTPTLDAADQVVEQILADPERTRAILRPLIHYAAYLSAKAEWDMQDNFDAAEWINNDVAREIPQDLALAIVGESGFDLGPEEIEDHLRPYLLDLDSEGQD